MFRFWFFGVIISIAALNFNAVTGSNECDRICRTLGPIIVETRVPHSSESKFCICTPAVDAELRNCGPHETWSNVEKKCILDDEMTKGCVSHCPKECDTVIAHKECSKYCHCKKGSVTVEECPGSFHFSKEKIICLPPEKAGCADTILPEMTTSSPRRFKLSSVTECEGKCPSMNSRTETVHLPHKYCQKFCKCDWGGPVVMDCPDTLHFNRKLQVCDYPEKAGCTGLGSL